MESTHPLVVYLFRSLLMVRGENFGFFVNTIAKVVSLKSIKKRNSSLFTVGKENINLTTFVQTVKTPEIYSPNGLTTQTATEGGGTGGNLVVKE